jgi:hypothetical protein
MEVRTRSICLLLLNPLDLAKLSYQNHLTQKPITELVVSLIVNNEEHLLRSLADTGASSSSSIILEAYTSAILPFIKRDDSSTTTWSTMGSKFTSTNSGIYLWPFHSQSSTLRNKCDLLGHFMSMTVLGHQAHMIWLLATNRDLLGELGIIIHLNDHTVTWDTDTIPMKDRDTDLYHQ